MMEIERKYLVRHAGYRDLSCRQVTICQGYLTHDAARSVRIRIAGDSAWITIKGRSSDDGLQRYEWEQPVELHQAQQLMRLCLPGRVEKTRYYVDWQGLTIEVDEFHGQNEGL
ncbi:MAG: CYTH domain-containing protein, partial [Paludibacteraceae bacterium]|nr:CYTH domain-containing protein [Paludibacteraceae bacterium]